MARSKLNAIVDDVNSDTGAILWSFVKGEQLEFPITLDFLALTQSVENFTFEAVVIEADNITDQLDKPSAVKAGAVKTTLVVRKPNFRGDWDANTAYNYEDFVVHGGIIYRLLNGVARINATPPSGDTYWEVSSLNRVYVQFPMTLAATWAVQPTIIGNVYGFFELRMTEPSNSILTKTWKPVRGMVEIGYSPTDEVADV